MFHGVSHAPQTAGRVIHRAASYDLLIPLFSFGQVRRIHRRIADLIQAKPGDAVLDVACGPGDLALLLAERVGAGGLAAGIDASPEMIARARRKAQRRHAAVDFRLEPIEALSFADETFDAVVSSFAFHHLPEEVKRQGVAGIARVLKPGGQVCIVDFMPRAGQPRRRMATDMSALADMLRDAGFTDVMSSREIPSFGVLHGLLGIASPGFVLARKPRPGDG